MMGEELRFGSDRRDLSSGSARTSTPGGMESSRHTAGAFGVPHKERTEGESGGAGIGTGNVDRDGQASKQCHDVEIGVAAVGASISSSTEFESDRVASGPIELDKPPMC